MNRTPRFTTLMIKEHDMTTSHTTATLAADFATTPRTLRKFLRSADMGVGKGSRYALPGTKREVNALRKRFTAWGEAQDAARAAKVETPAAPEVTPEVDDEGTSFDDLECPLDA